MIAMVKYYTIFLTGALILWSEPSVASSLDSEISFRFKVNAAQKAALRANLFSKQASEDAGANQQKIPFFKWPLDRIAISSRFGRRKAPLGDRSKVEYHRGLDMVGPLGLPVTAAARGEVIFAGPRGRAGNAVILSHGRKLKSYYFHMLDVLVFEGLMVEQGAPVGLLGSTGRSTGPHLHFQVNWGKKAVNPYSVLHHELETLKSKKRSILRKGI